MTNKSKKRNVFSTANKYQDKIVLLSFLPSTLIFLAFITIVFIGNPIISQAVFHSSVSSITNLVYTFTGTIIFLLCFIILLSMIFSFVISHRIVGPFGRIIKELDDVIEGKTKRLITSRPGDELAEDFLKRVNVLVDFYTKNKTQYDKD